MTEEIFQNITFIHDYTTLPFPVSELKDVSQKMLTNENVNTQQAINVILCSDYKIRKLNREYRKKDRATDVLSFSYNDSFFLGEIYISAQRVIVQSKRFGLTYAEELRRLFIHGFFHLLGYDHIEENDRIIMESKEKQYF